MPIYEYKCEKCACRFELKRRFDEDEGSPCCPQCNGKVRRLFSPTAIIFKGPGFYVTDSRSNGDRLLEEGKTDKVEGGKKEEGETDKVEGGKKEEDKTDKVGTGKKEEGKTDKVEGGKKEEGKTDKVGTGKKEEGKTDKVGAGKKEEDKANKSEAR
ncbi:FmdB family zinc ribbon protein [Chloroflexota bacterium]